MRTAFSILTWAVKKCNPYMGSVSPYFQYPLLK
jgi:hypothetical protein